MTEDELIAAVVRRVQIALLRKIINDGLERQGWHICPETLDEILNGAWDVSNAKSPGPDA